jgi:hypothetical protein
MSTDLNLNQVTFQSSLRSKPVRDNFTDIKNEHNLLRAEVLALATPPAGTEVTLARDYHTSLVNRLRSGFSVFDRYMVSGGVVAEDTGLNMKVTVALGEAVVAGVGCSWSAQTSGTITPHASLDRWDIVVVNTDNSISIVAGTAAASPILPTIASTQKKLAYLYITGGMTAIVDADITDARSEEHFSTFMRGGEWIDAGLVAGDFSAGFGTVTNVAFKMCRLGNSLRLAGSFKCGTITTGIGRINLPTGFTHDPAYIQGAGLSHFGQYTIFSGDGVEKQLNTHGVAFYNGNTDSFDLARTSQNGILITTGVTLLVDDITTPHFHLNVEIPVIGW